MQETGECEPNGLWISLKREDIAEVIDSNLGLPPESEYYHEKPNIM
jgi:hypothetical protein